MIGMEREMEGEIDKVSKRGKDRGRDGWTDINRKRERFIQRYKTQ